MKLKICMLAALLLGIVDLFVVGAAFEADALSAGQAIAWALVGIGLCVPFVVDQMKGVYRE